MTKDDVIKLFKETNALLNGHFLLTSGKHSDTYFQCAKILEHPNHTESLLSEIVEYFKSYEIDIVIAPAMGGIIVGYEVARGLGKRFVFTERENGKMTLRRNFQLEKKSKVLVCEDVTTTGGSVFEVMEIVKNSEAEVIGVAMIVDRSNGKIDFGVPTKSVLKLDVVAYESIDCPICKTGKPLVKPGSRIVK
jgi:orotate phosphoribosyltransferase